MTLAAQPAADRFAYIMESLCRALGDPRFGPLPAGPILLAIFKRLRRIATRFAVLAAQTGSQIASDLGTLRAGALPAAGSRLGGPTRRPRSPPSERATASRLAALAAARQAPRLPNRTGWLTRMRPGLACFGGMLRHLLNNQEFQTLLAASAEIRKLIRSLCRMFGVPLIPLLREPRRKRRSKPSRVRIIKPRSLPPVVRALLAPPLPPAKTVQLLLRPGHDPLIPVPPRKKPA